MDGNHGAERYETIIIGGGQAGLATGYHLARLGRSFVILEAVQGGAQGVREPGGGPAGGRRLAAALGPAAPVHARPPRRAARLEVPGQGLVVPEPGRHGRLPGGVRRPLRPAGPHRHARGRGHRRRPRRLRGHRERPPLRGRQRGRRDRPLPGPDHPRLRLPARPGHRAAALQRVPGPVAAAGRRRPGRRRRQLRRRDRHRVRRPAPGVAVGAGGRRHPVPHGRAAVAAAAGAAGPAGPVPPGADGEDADGQEDAGAEGLAGAPR